jgi:hypothetical protein
MSRGICPKPLEARADCPVAERPGGCFSDIDHRTPQRFKNLGWLVRWYINTPDNKERLCRWEHEQKSATESAELIPEETVMLDAISRAVESRYFNFNPRNQRRFEAVRLALSEQPHREVA